MVRISELEKVLAIEEEKHAQNENFVKMQEMVKYLQDEGIIKKPTYNLSGMDTVGHWVHQIRTNVVRY